MEDGFAMECFDSILNIREHLAALGVLQFLSQYGLICLEQPCPRCPLPAPLMKPQRRGRKYHEADLRCPSCRQWGSWRRGTFMQRFRTAPGKVVEVIVGWINRYPESRIAQEVEIPKSTVQSKIVNCRGLISAWMSENDNRIGGIGHTVEFDESICIRKLNSNQIENPEPNSNWVVGGIDHQTNHTFFALCKFNDTATIRQVCLDHILPETFILTSNWNGFDLKGLGFSGHARIPLNQNNSHWSKVKRDLSRRVRKINSETALWDVLNEENWRSRQRSAYDMFLDFCKAVDQFYN